ncbi:MAG: hypothetical protein JXL97_07910 [Bacteroidales bacterium]|nr:hypothetical protein [Bacteroidales bacterium]
MKNFFVIVLLLTAFNSFSQVNSKLVLDLPFADFKYMSNSAMTYSNHYPASNVKWYDYLRAYNSPSMQQTLSASASFYNSLNYAYEVININWFNKDFLNYLTESTILITAELLSTYVPLGDAWLHEEFHRTILTNNNVRSYDQVNDLPFFSELISVNRVTDEDLIRFKASNPQDFVRLHAAGIEGEYMLTHKLQSYNFFYDQKLPYFTYTLYWTVNSFYYVWFCHTHDAEITTNDVNTQDGSDIEIRDFTGLDFLAWTYDLYNPYEPYENRGIHPSGVGIDRYIVPSDLTQEQMKYLTKQGYLQMINFLYPMLIGVNKIPFNRDKNSYFNFAARHLLTSFGSDVSFYFFYKQEKLNLISGVHLYQNQIKSMPGIELELIDYDFKFKDLILRTSAKTLIWFQPENLLFVDNNADFGGLIDLKLKMGKKTFFPYAQITAKTKGWVAGNEFQNQTFSFKAGLSWYLF